MLACSDVFRSANTTPPSLYCLDCLIGWALKDQLHACWKYPQIHQKPNQRGGGYLLARLLCYPRNIFHWQAHPDRRIAPCCKYAAEARFLKMLGRAQATKATKIARRIFVDKRFRLTADAFDDRCHVGSRNAELTFCSFSMAFRWDITIWSITAKI